MDTSSRCIKEILSKTKQLMKKLRKNKIFFQLHDIVNCNKLYCEYPYISSKLSIASVGFSDIVYYVRTAVFKSCRLSFMNFSKKCMFYDYFNEIKLKRKLFLLLSCPYLIWYYKVQQQQQQRGKQSKTPLKLICLSGYNCHTYIGLQLPSRQSGRYEPG